MRLKNKSQDHEAYIYLLENLKIPPNTTVLVPSYFTEKQVRMAIRPFYDVVLLDGSILTMDDILDAQIEGHSGVMSKSTYDKDYNNIVDSSENTKPLSLEFTFADFLSVSKLLGNIATDTNIENIQVNITEAFDSGSISLGYDGDLSNIMDSSSIDLTYQTSYVIYVGTRYTSDTDVHIYFNGTPTKGSAKLIVFTS